MNEAKWRTTGELAFTTADGPGRPPRGVRPGLLLAAGTIAGTALGVILFTDSLCPEHRMQVRLLGAVGIAVALMSIVASVRGSAGAPVLTLAAAVAGAGIGALDTLHSPVRGSFVLVAFIAVVALAAWPLAVQLRQSRWGRANAVRDDRDDEESDVIAAPATSEVLDAVERSPIGR